ncbi:MAG TPA: zf-HC2 domain-containing protein [Thermoanaerobaculia bacterium]|nr:zf-HC2 domain-containing protein [Thermoanaerobaculia bacterium]
MSLKTENLISGTAQSSPDDAGEHPSIDILGDYHRGRLTEADEDRIQEHFISCAGCRETMLDLADFLDGVSEPSRWSSEDLVRQWRKVHTALKEKSTPSGRAAEALAGRHG